MSKLSQIQAMPRRELMEMRPVNTKVDKGVVTDSLSVVSPWEAPSVTKATPVTKVTRYRRNRAVAKALLDYGVEMELARLKRVHNCPTCKCGDVLFTTNAEKQKAYRKRKG